MSYDRAYKRCRFLYGVFERVDTTFLISVTGVNGMATLPSPRGASAAEAMISIGSGHGPECTAGKGTGTPQQKKGPANAAKTAGAQPKRDVSGHPMMVPQDTPESLAEKASVNDAIQARRNARNKRAERTADQGEAQALADPKAQTKQQPKPKRSSKKKKVAPLGGGVSGSLRQRKRHVHNQACQAWGTARSRTCSTLRSTSS